VASNDPDLVAVANYAADHSAAWAIAASGRRWTRSRFSATQLNNHQVDAIVAGIRPAATWRPCWPPLRLPRAADHGGADHECAFQRSGVDLRRHAAAGPGNRVDAAAVAPA